MRTRARAASILAVGTVGAQGADIPVKAPVYKVPAVQVYDWTGPYIGVNVGGSVGRSRTHTNDPGAVVENETTYLSATGAIGGGQIGYNWQIPSFSQSRGWPRGRHPGQRRAWIGLSGQLPARRYDNSEPPAEDRLVRHRPCASRSRVRPGVELRDGRLCLGPRQHQRQLRRICTARGPVLARSGLAADSQWAAAWRLHSAATGQRRSNISTSISDNRMLSSKPGLLLLFSELRSTCRPRREIISTAAVSIIVSAATMHFRRRLPAGAGCTSAAMQAPWSPATRVRMRSVRVAFRPTRETFDLAPKGSRRRRTDRLQLAGRRVGARRRSRHPRLDGAGSRQLRGRLHGCGRNHRL